MVLGEQFGNKPVSDSALMSFSAAVFLIPALFMLLRLETQIREDGIYVRFFPFHFKFKHYPWEKVNRAYVREYSALAEYGGWGIRFGFGGSGKAFNVSGKQGLQLEFTDGSKLLIGTRKAEEMRKAVAEVMSLSLES